MQHCYCSKKQRVQLAMFSLAIVCIKWINYFALYIVSIMEENKEKLVNYFTYIERM